VADKLLVFPGILGWRAAAFSQASSFDIRGIVINSSNTTNALPADAVQISQNNFIKNVDQLELLISYDREAHFDARSTD
jgi:hypothetical protein